jgi:hypothetical protein
MSGESRETVCGRVCAFARSSYLWSCQAKPSASGETLGRRPKYAKIVPRLGKTAQKTTADTQGMRDLPARCTNSLDCGLVPRIPASPRFACDLRDRPCCDEVQRLCSRGFAQNAVVCVNSPVVRPLSYVFVCEMKCTSPSVLSYESRALHRGCAHVKAILDARPVPL